MAYCNQCGAYIPDEHTKCLACGYDEEAAETAAQAQTQQAKGGTAAGTQVHVDVERMRRQMDEQRRKQREYARKWADAERERRSQTRARASFHDEESRNSEAHERQETSSGTDGFQQSKLLAALSYVGFLFVLPYIFCKDDEFSNFHAKQGLILFIYNIAARILSFIGLGWLFRLASIYFLICGISNAVNGKREKLPLIGTII